MRGSGDGKVARTKRVHRVGFSDARLGSVHVVESRGIDQQAWPMSGKGLTNLGEHRNIERSVAQRDDFMALARGYKASAELPTRACEQDFQLRTSLTEGIRLICSLSVRAAASLGESRGDAVGHAIPIEGSFQMMRNSSSGS